MFRITKKSFILSTLAPKLITLLIGLFCLPGAALETVSAQNLNSKNKLQFDRVSIDQGLSHSYVMYVMQDRKGYLWFGTGNGLDKYDGYNFTNYKFDSQDSTTIPKNQVFLMWEDRDGLIWVGTAEGICRFDPRTEKFTRLEKSPSNPYAFSFAQSFNEDEEGNIWVGGSFEGELRQIDRQTGKFSATNFASMLRSDSVGKDERLHIIYKDKRGTLWIGSPSGLHRLNLNPQGKGKPTKMSFTHFRHDPADPSSLSPDGVAGIYEDHTGIFWIATYAGVLDAFDPKSGKFTHYLPAPNKPFTFFSLLGCGITEDLEGNLWIGTTNGLYKLDKDRKEFSTFLHDQTDPGSIDNNFIMSLLVDQSGILWVTTNEGINKVDPHQKPFLVYRHNPLNSNSLSHNKITAICEDKEGTIWVGTIGRGLNALNEKSGEFTHYRYNPNDVHSLRSDIVSAILEDRDGNLWIGNGQTLSLFNHRKNNFTHYSFNHPFSESNGGFSIFTIYEDRDNIIWLGTNNGILNFDRKTGKTVHFPYDPDKPEGISDWWALSILEDSKGNLWIGPGSQALTKFDRRTGTFTQYKHDNRIPGSIASNTIPSIHEDSKGRLWFGTGEGGLCLFHPDRETFTTYDEKDGLAGSAVYSILEDNTGDLWLGTNNGLSRFSPAEKTFTNYDVADGLQSKLFTSLYTKGACFKGTDGTLYFGGTNGLNAFHPSDIHPNPNVPPVVITQFKLFDKIIPGKHEAKEIVLKYDQNFFSLEFAALNYTSSHKNQYSYQLQGVDKEWVQTDNLRSASYTDISPGKYVFNVKGSNNDGVWNEKGASLAITILPPWWLTWWAYIFYGLCFLAGIVTVDRFQRRRLIHKEQEKARERELEQAKEIEKAYHVLKETQAQLVQKEKAELENEIQLERMKKKQELAAYQSRMVELEMQALRAQMNPHFIFNSLNSINRFILKNESEAASDYLTKFSKLIRLILHNSQSSSVPLASELEALRLYIEMEVSRFEGQFTYEILLDPYLEVEELELPPLIIQPYVENAIWHGLMHKEGRGHLLIELHCENEKLYCQITDNGVGRKRAAEFKSKSASKNKSLGMQITSHRLELINALNEKETTVEIFDLVDPEGVPCGTKVLLKIPV